MLLAVDVGNSHMVLGIFNQRELIQNWRVQTDRNCTADELAQKIYSLFILEKITFPDIEAIIIASVVPPLKSAWQICTEKYFNLEPIFVNSTIKTDLKIKIDNPAEVGADRIVNAVVAFARHNKPLIIVDFGTAITFDCVSAAGEYIGGAIAPGLAISLAALGRETSKLPAIDISSPPKNPIGTNTVDAIKSGIIHGYGGLVEGIIRQIKKQFSPDLPHVMATGGMARLIAPYAPSIKEVDPMLTLKGLQLLYEKNS
jgi:type III pantothenate kinase